MVRFGDVVKQVKVRVDPDTAGLDRYVAGEHMSTDDLRIRRWGEVGDGYLGPAFNMKFQPGQVLYGSRRTYLRKVAVPDFEGICANTTFVVESSSPDLLQEFLPYAMTTETFHEHSIKQSKGSVNPYINFTDLKWYEFALPPIDEQERIVEVMAACDASLDASGLVAEKADEACRAVFESAIQDVETVPLGELCEVDLGRQRAPKFASGENMVPYIRAANVKHRRLEIDDVLEMNFTPEEQIRFDLRQGDVLVSEGCGSIAEIGANVVWQMEIQSPVCFQNTVLRLRAKTGLMDPNYLAAWCDAAFLGGRFAAIATGTSIFHLGARRTATMEVPLMSLDQQRSLAAEIEILMTLGATAKQAQVDLRMVRNLLLNEALRSGTEDVH